MCFLKVRVKVRYRILTLRVAVTASWAGFRFDSLNWTVMAFSTYIVIITLKEFLNLVTKFVENPLLKTFFWK